MLVLAVLAGTNCNDSRISISSKTALMPWWALSSQARHSLTARQCAATLCQRHKAAVQRQLLALTLSLGSKQMCKAARKVSARCVLVNNSNLAV